MISSPPAVISTPILRILFTNEILFGPPGVPIPLASTLESPAGTSDRSFPLHEAVDPTHLSCSRTLMRLVLLCQKDHNPMSLAKGHALDPGHGTASL